jgi:predicted nucleic acid-binding protein
LKKLRRYPEQRSLLLAAYRMSGRMEIKQTDVDLNAVIAFAEQERITVYDATYLWLSHRLGAEIITLDKKLAEAAVES